MKLKKHYKLITSIILVFISGLLIGGGLTYVMVKKQDEHTASLEKFKANIFNTMVQNLKLTPEQQVKIKVLLDKGIERMMEFRKKHTPELLMIIKENNQGLAQILTPEQWELYQGYRNDKLKNMPNTTP